MYRILIVEDDEKIGALLQSCINKYGFEARVAEKLSKLGEEFAEIDPHLVLMDINLPYFDGFYWCRQFRSYSNAPVIFISARVGEMDQVMAIENGGDDYLTKPIHLDLLMAKIKSALRRAYGEYAAAANGGKAEAISIGGLSLDTGRNLLFSQGHMVELTKNERMLVQCLIEAGGSIVPREELLESLWDDVQFVDDNTLTVNVTRLRKKMEELGLSDAVETIRGQGYRLNMETPGKGSESK